MTTKIVRALIVVLSIAPGIAPGAEPPPNIILIYADDLGWGDVGFNGRKEWATPNLDRLGAEGTIFKRHYTAAVVCAPSRAAMLTGKCTIHCGVSKNNDDLPASEETIAEALKARGYATALFGKWHHGKPREGQTTYVHPMDQGFDEFFGFTDATHAWEKFPRWLFEGRERKNVSGYADDIFTDRAVAFIERQKAGPFFLYLPLISAHSLIEAPADEIALHKGKFPEPNPRLPIYATYAAMVTRLDREVGRVLTALDERGIARSTLVFFSSDHGATFETGNLGTSNYHDSNQPLRGQKRTLWEGGVRVPAAVRWPGHIPAGVVTHEPTYMCDLFPTFLAAAGMAKAPEPARHLDGVDLLPFWTGHGKIADRTLFWEWRSEGCDQIAALRRDMKLVITNGGKPELFQVEADPGERRNIAALHLKIVKDLGEQLHAWLATQAQP